MHVYTIARLHNHDRDLDDISVSKIENSTLNSLKNAKGIYIYRSYSTELNVIPKHIPPELIHQISLSLPRTDLVSMTTVNRCFQAEAERLLYESIGHGLSVSAMISCFDILIAVKSKAIFVRSLLVDHSDPETLLIERLCDCIPVLLSLTHLQLLLPYETSAMAIPLINAAFE